MPSVRIQLSPMAHLVDAIHDVRPPALANPTIDHDDPMHTVTVTYVMTPELIKAWGEKWSRGSRNGTQPPSATSGDHQDQQTAHTASKGRDNAADSR